MPNALPRFASLATASLIALAGCASAPETQAEQHDLERNAEVAKQEMVERDPSLEGVLSSADAYIVFPSVGEGAFVVGGASGVGVVYENGRNVGYAEMAEGSVGAQVGGQAFSELIVFENDAAFEEFADGEFTFGADAVATAVNRGAAANTAFEDGVAVFVDRESGFMAEASIGGQKLSYKRH